MARYLLALGSSHLLGKHYLERAQERLGLIRGASFVSSSRIYKNQSADTDYNCIFHNAVVAMTSPLNPEVFYRELAAIETYLGRIRSFPNAPRTIDIDVLMSLDFTYISSGFFLPHREALNRNFFVLPAIEALRSASWPLSLLLLKASHKLGRGLLSPVH